MMEYAEMHYDATKDEWDEGDTKTCSEEEFNKIQETSSFGVEECDRWFEYTQKKGYFTEYDIFFALNDAYDDTGATDGNIYIHYVTYNPKTKEVDITYST